MASKTTATVTGNDAVEILENDHRRIKELLAQLVEASGDDARTGVLDELKALLTVHNASEENLIYPAVRVLAKRRSESETLYHQQDEAKVAVWELDMLAEDDRDFEARATKLQAAVHAHIAKEEETEFPKLREAAGEEAMEELTAALRELRGALHFNPPRASGSELFGVRENHLAGRAHPVLVVAVRVGHDDERVLVIGGEHLAAERTGNFVSHSISLSECER